MFCRVWVSISGWKNHMPFAEGCSVIEAHSQVVLKSSCYVSCHVRLPPPPFGVSLGTCGGFCLFLVCFGFFDRLFYVLVKARNLNLKRRGWTLNKLNYLMCVNVCLPRQKQLKRRLNCRCPNSFGMCQVFVLVLYYRAHNTAAESKLNKAKKCYCSDKYDYIACLEGS